MEEARLFMRTAEVAKLIGISERSARYRCERGDIKATKLGRDWLINRAALMTLLGITDEEEVR